MKIQIKNYKLIINSEINEAVIFYTEHLNKVKNSTFFADLNKKDLSFDIYDPDKLIAKKLQSIKTVILVSIDTESNPSSFVEVRINE